MPYRHAHYYLLLLIVLTGLAFWPIYFSLLPSASVALHIHGFSASLWIALLTFQSWAIHRRCNEWHRVVGIASLAIFPFFFAGSALIVHTMAWNFATGDFFDSRFGARFAAFDLVAVPAIAFLFWSGLRWRRKVHLHARYMLATVFFLFEPIFSRLFIQYVPGLQIAPPDFAMLPTNVELSSFGALMFALVEAAQTWSAMADCRRAAGAADGSVPDAWDDEAMGNTGPCVCWRLDPDRVQLELSCRRSRFLAWLELDPCPARAFSRGCYC
jgi:hypothetical protein